MKNESPLVLCESQTLGLDGQRVERSPNEGQNTCVSPAWHLGEQPTSPLQGPIPPFWTTPPERKGNKYCIIIFKGEE